MADRTWSAYATPSQRDTSLVVDNESGRPIGGGLAGWLAALSPWLVLSGHFITWSGTHTLYVNAARAHSRSRTPWSEIGTPPCRHISFFARLPIPLVQNFRAEHTLLHGVVGGDSHILLES